MQRHDSVLSIFFLSLATAGCGANVAQGEDESSGSDPTSPTDPTDPTDPTGVPLDCEYDGEVHPSGSEFEASDGCATYRCDNGGIVLLDDTFVTVQGDLALASQADVDAQECLSEVTGALTISGDAADFSGLNHLARVGGNFTIDASAAVTLAGFEGLGEIGGNIVVANNASLTTMAFSPYMSVFGDATIQNNDALVALTGAEFLGQCGGCSTAASPLGEGDGTTDGGEPDPGGDASASAGGDDAGLTAGDEEPGGGTYYGNILIADNDLLVDVGAMRNLWFAWAAVRFRGNTALADLSVLQLSEVRGDLEVAGHPALDAAVVDAWALNIDVWGQRIICGNGDGIAC